MTKQSAKGATKRADALFSKHIRSRGRCEGATYRKVKCKGNLQCCHIRSRRYRAIRWDDHNALCMCAAHHLYFTHHPLEWEQFCRDVDIDYDGLGRKGLTGPPMNPFLVIERLRDVSGKAPGTIGGGSR